MYSVCANFWATLCKFEGKSGWTDVVDVRWNSGREAEKVRVVSKLI